MRIQNLVLLALILLLAHSRTLSHQCGFHAATLQFECCPPSFIYDDVSLSCICRPETPLRIGNTQCVPCPGTTYWDAASASCIACTGGKVYNSYVGQCMCLPQHYLTKDGTCITCDEPLFWDPNTRTCQNCPDNQLYDSNLKLCACPPAMPFLNYQNQCVACSAPLFWSNAKKMCMQCP